MGDEILVSIFEEDAIAVTDEIEVVPEREINDTISVTDEMTSVDIGLVPDAMEDTISVTDSITVEVVVEFNDIMSVTDEIGYRLFNVVETSTVLLDADTLQSSQLDAD